MMKGQDRKYIKRLCLWLYIYFAFALLVSLAVWAAMDEWKGAANLASTAILVLFTAFEFFFVYKAGKGKRWALVTLAIMFSAAIVYNFALALSMGKMVIPAIPLLILYFIIRGLKHVK
jgi:hypothetical protein